MAKKRSIKVISQIGHNYKATPTIMLKGQWLKELGFDIGDYVSITCENGKLVITPDTERAVIAEAEAAFYGKRNGIIKEEVRGRKGKTSCSVCSGAGCRICNC